MIDVKDYPIGLPIDLHSQTHIYPPDAFYFSADVLGYPVSIGLLVRASPAVRLLDCLQVIDHSDCELASVSGLIPREGDLIEEDSELREVLPEQYLELAVVLSVSSVRAE